MKCFTFSHAAEMIKVAQGKKTKIPVELAVYYGLQHHPELQKKVGKAFGIR